MSLVYFSLWVIFNGRITFEVIIAGVIVSLMLDVFMKKILGIRFTGATFFLIVNLMPQILVYIFVLMIEIIRANFAIIRLVLAPEIEVEPCIVKFNTSLKTEAARTALANSITLTPGTITVSLEGNELLVHALNRDIAHGLEGSIFEKLLTRMERLSHD